MWVWIGQNGRCERCWQYNLTVANVVAVQDGNRKVGICPGCVNRELEESDVAKTTPKAEPQGSKYAGRFPGGKALHDEGGKLNWQWEKVGQELVGEFVGMKPYENGHIAKVREAESGIMRAFSAPSVLASYLDNISPGTQIGIVFSEEKPAKKRGLNPVKLFEVYELPEG